MCLEELGYLHHINLVIPSTSNLRDSQISTYAFAFHIFSIFQPRDLILWIESAQLCTQARYDLTDPQALARFLQDSDVRLVRAKCGPQSPCVTSTIKDTGVFFCPCLKQDAIVWTCGQLLLCAFLDSISENH